MSQKTSEVQIKPAKGRPMLTWVGKRPLRSLTAYPAQLVETYAAQEESHLRGAEVDWSDWPEGFPHSGLLFHGDNKDVLAHLLANGFRGKVKLIYIDPPFDSGADYIRRVDFRGQAPNIRIEGEGYEIGEQIQYSDIWANDNYLQFMYERIQLLKELLSDEGSICLHCDYRRAHYLKILMDEIFGQEYLQANIVWRSMTSSGFKGKRSIGRSHADLLYYSKTDKFTYNPIYMPYDEDYIAGRFNKRDDDGRRFKDEKVGSATPEETIERLRAEGRIYITSKGTLRIKHYLDEAQGILLDDVWTDIYGENSQSLDLTNYPTQKPSELLERIITMMSSEGDIVLDSFLGSGTTAAVAQRLGRRWIGADINKGAIQTTTKRLQGVIQEQASSLAGPTKQLPGLEDDRTPAPCQLSFSVYRVNDYDLQIQHNEAFNLAVEHLGMTRTRTDSFFDGTLGKRLVKIISFNHPLTPLDLEEVKNELASRPDESRDIAVVCLGKELAVEAWLEDWNRIRRQGDFPNKIEVIELRSDARYGGFFIHQPAQAEVRFERAGGSRAGLSGVTVTVENFLSPTILQRLEQQAGGPLLKPHITDWRAMVDSILIDANYDGQVFNISLADVPEKKSDLVKGSYQVESPEGASVAVKITDMLGEEVLVISQASSDRAD